MVRSLTAMLLWLPLFALGQSPGGSSTNPGPAIWGRAQRQYPLDQHYEVQFTFDRSLPTMRGPASSGTLIFSAGRYQIKLDELVWYFNGDTLWEYQPQLRKVEIQSGIHPMALSPAELFLILDRVPVTVRQHGEMEINGAVCDKLKLDFTGRNLPYHTAYLWVTKEEGIAKIVFLDTTQTSTTLQIKSLKAIPEPPASTFRLPSS